MLGSPDLDTFHGQGTATSNMVKLANNLKVLFSQMGYYF